MPVKPRRRYIVDKRLQYRFVAFCIAYLLISHFALSLYLFLPLATELEDPASRTQDILSAADKILYLHVHYWPLIIVSVLAVSLPVIILSRRLVGPLLRLKMTLDEMKTGIIPKPYNLRRGDYLVEEADVANAVLESMRLRFSEIKEGYEELHERILALSEEIEPGSHGDLVRKSEDLLASSHNLGKRIDYFKIGS